MKASAPSCLTGSSPAVSHIEKPPVMLPRRGTWSLYGMRPTATRNPCRSPRANRCAASTEEVMRIATRCSSNALNPPSKSIGWPV